MNERKTPGRTAASPPSLRIADQVDQVNRIVYGLGFSAGLNPAQWAALRYLARAEGAGCTVSALAHHQGVTAPTASETVSALVRKDLLVRSPSSSDRRSHRLSLTQAGIDLLDADPLHQVATAIETLSTDQRSHLGAALDLLAGQLRERRRTGRRRG
ncbi:MAG: winged helix-turn-helix transcriptional regulator [Alphaproteobacteria bacterium]|nr:winged helix-turn-helix transcriptional regulator [Alphaproteobacteria bacterium]